VGPYPATLDAADTIFSANYVLGYYRSSESAPHLMRLQKIEDLKEKSLWNEYNPSFRDSAKITGSDFGINIYAVGRPKDKRSKIADYQKLLDLTSTHINNGGWGDRDFVITITWKHQSTQLIESQPPEDEFVLGFIRLSDSVLNNKPLTDYLGVSKLTGDFANNHLVCAKVIVATQPFGKLLRGGKLLALLATSNELRDYFNKQHNRNIVVFYTTSLYGTTKENCQYDQLNRFLFHVGNTTGTTALRMKEPHSGNLFRWMNDRGFSKHLFTTKSSSKTEKEFREIRKFIRYCLWFHRKDPHCRKLLKQYDREIYEWDNGKTEQKRTFVSIYGMPAWDENLVAPTFEIDPSYNMDSLFNYWKKKVFQKRSWGLRKIFKEHNGEFNLGYELLHNQLKEEGFNQVR